MNLLKKWWFYIIIFIIILLFTTFPSTETITIGPNKVDCVGGVPMKCLIVNGERFYNSIDGFDYEEGYSYVLEVKITKIKNPPADASSSRYDLVKVISKEAE
ncbi:MAG: DUF4377 domain-containing protein [Nanoarchaeota archaeon]